MMRSVDSWLVVPAIIIPGLIASPVFAVQYMTAEQAQKLLFPGADQFSVQTLSLNAAQMKAVEVASGVLVRASEMNVSRASQAGVLSGWVLFDQVYGKHELINYAVAIGVDGAVKGVEILEYREARGNEVNNAKWRAQFIGKTSGNPVRLEQDIKNISGATLSCQHVTDGVRRLLATYVVALR